MGKISKWGKRTVAGTTAAAVLVGGGYIGKHFLEERGQAGAHGAVVDLQENNGMLLHDLRGRPAFVNYFDSTDPEKMELTISIATTQAMPGALSDRLGQLTKFRQEHVSTRVDKEDYRPVDDETAEVIRHFFREFEELTGIRVTVRENDSNADITIGGYVSHDNYVGFASFPQEIPELRHLPQNRGFMMLDVDYLQRKLKEGNVESVLALISHEFGHNLGLLHPHSDHVNTAMNEKQQDAVSRMAYNNHTFPAIATTDIDTGFGPLDIHIIREALRDLGIEPPRINTGNDTYLLSELAEQQREQARARGGYLTTVPALSLLDNGGRNTLEGTSGDDLLVTESGYCGLLKRDEKQIRLMKDGQPYCLVEGEFSVVRSGAGDDLILTANGTEQTVYLGTGNNEVAMLHPDIGDKTLVPLPVEDERGAVQRFFDKVDDLNPLTESEVAENATDETSRLQDDTVTLTLHESLFRAADVLAQQVGDDIRLDFYAMSGRHLGRITLQGQALEGQGINGFRIIDNDGNNVAEYDVSTLHDAETWQETVLESTQEVISERMAEGIRADLDRARQQLAGRAGEWTARGDDAPVEPVVEEPSGRMAGGHEGGCGCPSCITSVASPSPAGMQDMVPRQKQYPKGERKAESHAEAVLQRRRQQEESHGQGRS